MRLLEDIPLAYSHFSSGVELFRKRKRTATYKHQS